MKIEVLWGVHSTPGLPGPGRSGRRPRAQGSTPCLEAECQSSRRGRGAGLWEDVRTLPDVRKEFQG